MLATWNSYWMLLGFSFSVFAAVLFGIIAVVHFIRALSALNNAYGLPEPYKKARPFLFLCIAFVGLTVFFSVSAYWLSQID